MLLPRLAFDHVSVLLALPLAALPFLPVAGNTRPVPVLAFLPSDPLGTVLAWAARVLAALAIAGTVVALAAPYVPERVEMHTAVGAEIVIVLDRSRSMDESLATEGPPNAGGWTAARESKGKVARRLLAAFAAGRDHDRFALVVFSARPMRVLEFTDKAPAVQAAIAASDVGRGLADTNVAAGLMAALEQFENRSYNGSRVVLLVSDGGAQLDPETQQELARAFRRQRAQLYWIYLRSRASPGLRVGADADAAGADTVPEVALDRFFRSVGMPYAVYEADNPNAMSRAIADVAGVVTQPIEIAEPVPRRVLRTPWVVLAALSTALLLVWRLAAVGWEARGS